MQARPISYSETTMTELIMPNDTNYLGNLMGGYMMRWMDIAGAICASKHCGNTVVTASVDHINFDAPIKLGQCIKINACVTRAFNSSVEVFMEVFVSDITGQNSRKSNHAYFTFVAIDKDTGKTQKVPPVLPLSEEEQKRYDSAIRRREIRLILAGKIKAEEASEVRTFFNNMN